MARSLHLPRPVVERLARYTVKPSLRAPLRVRRAAIEALARLSRVPSGVTVTRQARGGIPGELATPEGALSPTARILYLHGGGYECGSPRTHRNVVAMLAQRSGLPVFAADYRLAPEHPAPAALDDALAVYEAMAADAGGGLALAGDSAGGGLAVALAVAVRDAALPAPPGLALISPWVDLTMSGRSITENERRDALLPRQAGESGARSYAQVLGAEDPICSPIRAELSGLPPMLIHVGAHELLLSEGEELARRAEAAGVEVDLKVYDGLWHTFHNHAGMLRDADDALGELGAFLRAQLATEGSPARS